MGPELELISCRGEIDKTIQLFFFVANKLEKPHIPILSIFQSLKNIEIDEKLSFSDSLALSKIPSEPNINKVCRVCNRPFRTRFPEIDICSLKCKNFKKQGNGMI